MEAKEKKSQRLQATVRVRQAVQRLAKSPRKARNVEKAPMPLLVAGREVMGRHLKVFKDLDWEEGTVVDFDPIRLEHKVRFLKRAKEGSQREEEWMCLAKRRFLWNVDSWSSTQPNPTFSARYTPQAEDAVDKKVKVFWPGEGKWYQGKVAEYDKATGKHRVSFRDGDEKSYILRQEAVLWLDIPQLASDAALKKTRAEENNREAMPRDAAKDGAVEAEQGSSSSHKRRQGNANGGVASRRKPHRSHASKDGNHSDAQSQDQPRSSGRLELSSRSTQPTPPHTLCESADARGATSEARTGGSGSKEASATRVGVERDADCDTGAVAGTKGVQANEHAVGDDADSKSASSSSDEQDKAAAGNAEEKGRITVKILTSALSLGTTGQSGEDSNRKRSRLGLPALTGTAAGTQQTGGQPPLKRRPLTKLGRPAVKPGRKPRRLEDGRTGSRKPRQQADIDFEDACEAVMGARIGVWWPDDEQFYKGKLISHDWYHKRLKVAYDDGVDEMFKPLNERFRWLLPRARTAGATDAIHAAMQVLGAINATAPVTAVPAPSKPQEAAGTQAAAPPSAAPASSPHTADGSHLDALVPLRPGSGLHKPEEGVRAPHPVDGTTRALAVVPKGATLLSMASAISVGVPTPSGWGDGPLRTGQASPATTPAGLQSMVPSVLPSASAAASQPDTGPSSWPVPPKPADGGSVPAVAGDSLAVVSTPAAVPSARVAVPGGGDQRFGITPEPGAPSAPCGCRQPAPTGATAEGWRFSMVFRGDGRIYTGRVVAYSAAKGRHHLLYDDGEDEWVDITKEPLTWHADRPRNSNVRAGLPEGEREPMGDELENWQIAVYWKREQMFYQGTIKEYDADTQQHLIAYDDGDEDWESLGSEIFKYVLPPTLSTVQPRKSGRKREPSTDREDSAERRVARRRPRLERDSSPDEWPVVSSIPSRFQRLDRGSTPAVVTPRACDIRRLNSRLGSLMVYPEDEERLKGSTPTPSPNTSPRGNAAPHHSPTPEPPNPLGTPYLMRSVAGLRVMGTRLNVRRVRVYLRGVMPKQKENEDKPDADVHDAEAAGKELCVPAAGESTALPTQVELKEMLHRVDCAERSITQGIPVGMDDRAGIGAPEPLQRTDAQEEGVPAPEVAASQPEQSAAEPMKVSTILSRITEAAAASAEALTPLHHEEHTTPPPSPFALHAAQESEWQDPETDATVVEDDSAPSKPISEPCVDKAGVKELNVAAFASGSITVPDTPSVGAEAGLPLTSRNSSAVGAAMVVALAEAKRGGSEEPSPAA